MADSRAKPIGVANVSALQQAGDDMSKLNNILLTDISAIATNFNDQSL